MEKIRRKKSTHRVKSCKMVKHATKTKKRSRKSKKGLLDKILSW